jgi:hypothetical protein
VEVVIKECLLSFASTVSLSAFVALIAVEDAHDDGYFHRIRSRCRTFFTFFLVPLFILEQEYMSGFFLSGFSGWRLLDHPLAVPFYSLSFFTLF